MAMMHQAGRLFYGLQPNPTTEASARVTSFTENASPETVRIPATFTTPGFDRVVQTVVSLDIEFLDDSDTGGQGGFARFLAANSGSTIHLVWQPTGTTNPRAAYRCTAVRPTRGGSARNPMIARVTLPVEEVTDSWPT